MTESLEELAGDSDQLIAPPRNPSAPPQALTDMVSTIARNSEAPSHSILNTARSAVGHTLNWGKFPGQVMDEVKPETKGKWSEEDEFRQQQQLAQQAEWWGPQTALGIVFDPLPALATRLSAPAGAYALRNMRTTPVEGNPFAGGAAPEVALGVFAGPGAKTANMAKLDRARALEQAGKAEDEIWRETGWFRGADKKWRFEIDDSKAKFNIGGHKQVRPMGEVVEHPELYEAYPDIGKIKTETYGASGEGYHQPAASKTTPATEKIRVPTGDMVYDPIDPARWPTLAKREAEKGLPESQHSSRNVALHEIQHAIQSREGFATGGDPKALMPAVMEEVKKHPALYGKEKDLAFETYQRLAGEVESRNVASRSRGSDQSPWKTEDRPREKQIVRDVRLAPVDYNPFQ